MKNNNSKQSKNRRSFLRGSLATGAAVIGASALSENKLSAAPPPTRGDVAILRFLAAAELIEADLWQKYAELGGVTPGPIPRGDIPGGRPVYADEQLPGGLDEPRFRRPAVYLQQ